MEQDRKRPLRLGGSAAASASPQPLPPELTPRRPRMQPPASERPHRRHRASPPSVPRRGALRRGRKPRRQRCPRLHRLRRRPARPPPKSRPRLANRLRPQRRQHRRLRRRQRHRRPPRPRRSLQVLARPSAQPAAPRSLASLRRTWGRGYRDCASCPTPWGTPPRSASPRRASAATPSSRCRSWGARPRPLRRWRPRASRRSCLMMATVLRRRRDRRGPEISTKPCGRGCRIPSRHSRASRPRRAPRTATVKA
mmetsp:Transcript_37294/g.115164  ORF Transcript_37294/g.115164 Transcript_37294/m.115164 type:complete len:253 (-) Transcript_37294:2152-2910(-)